MRFLTLLSFLITASLLSPLKAHADFFDFISSFFNPRVQTAQISGVGSGLVGYWTFDEGSGSTAGDSSGNSNTGALTNGPTWTTGRVGSGAVSFDGADDYMSLPHFVPADNERTTIAFWVKFNANPEPGMILMKGSSSDYKIQYSNPTAPRLGFVYFNLTQTINMGASYPLGFNTWKHVVFVGDGLNGSKWYVDGVLNLSTTIPFDYDETNISSWFIGAQSAVSNFTAISMDDLRFYNRVLSASEVAELYAYGSTGSPPPSPTPVNGVCGSTVNSCTTGTFTDTTDSSTNYLWSCVGSDGGTTASCSLPITVAPTPPSSSGFINAISCSQTDVQNAINQAKDGDTVVVPAGTCTWNQTVTIGSNNWDGSKNVYIGKAITLIGAGIDKTVILDNVPVVNTQASILKYHTATSGLCRVTGFTFKTSPGNTASSYGGKIVFLGDSKTFRFDNNKFDFNTIDRAISVYGWIYGVVDHNDFTGQGQFITVYHDAWGGKTYGDGSWSAPLSLGSGEAVFIENNVIKDTNGGGSTDAFSGARYVLRYNTLERGNANSHGTDSTGRQRGIFSVEVYNNTFIQPSGQYGGDPLHLRGGTGVFFNNTLLGTWWNGQVTLNTYRNRDSFAPFGVCDGSSLYDKNNGVVYESGIHTGSSVTNGTLSTNKNWAVDQWVGYSLRNTTRSWGSQVKSNTGNTIVIEPSVYSSPREWVAGDSFEIVKVDACLDQPGRSTGDLFSNDFNNPTPKAWPNQSLEPFYSWGNAKNNISYNTITANSYAIKDGREYFSGICRPGYTPYTYPHPLTGLPAQQQNLNCSSQSNNIPPVTPAPTPSNPTPQTPPPPSSNPPPSTVVTTPPPSSNVSGGVPSTPQTLSNTTDVNFGTGLYLAESSDGVRLSWTNSNNLRSYIVRKQGSVPTSPQDGEGIINAITSSTLDSGVEKGRRYYYTLYLERNGTLEKWGEANIAPTLITKTDTTIRPLVVPPRLPVAPTTTSTGASTSTTKKPPFTRTLTVGSKGTDVKLLQDYLVTRGFLQKNSTTGTFGGLTERAVRKLQCRENILCKGTRGSGYGVVSGSTLTRLNALHGFKTSSTPVKVSAPKTTPTDLGRTLSLGMTGSDVKLLQEILIKEKLLPTGSNSGIFGVKTKEAVIKFQEKYAKEILTPSGLTKGSGLVGVATQKKIRQLAEGVR